MKVLDQFDFCPLGGPDEKQNDLYTVRSFGKRCGL